MRARNIKPGFWKNEDLVELPFEHRLLFIGLWMLADRKGRLEDRPKRIKMELFPADNVNVEAGLEDLTALGLLERYEYQGVKVILIAKFLEHQSPHHSEKRSELPGKSGYDTEDKPKKAGGATDKKPGVNSESTGTEQSNNGEDTEGSQGKESSSTDKSPETYGKPTVDSPNDTGRNRPDSLNPDSPNPESIEKTSGTSASDAPPPAKRKSRSMHDYSPEFELAWQKYPPRDGSDPKTKAYQAWKARIAEGVDPAAMLSGVIRYADYLKAKGKLNTEFVMQAARFFGPEREFENDWNPPPEPDGWPKSKHNGFAETDYNAGLKQEVRDGEANF